MKRSKIVLTAMIMLTAIGSVFAYKTYRAQGNLYSTTTTTTQVGGPQVTTYVRIPCHTLNQGLGACTITTQKYSFNGIAYVPYNPAGFAAPSAQ